MGLASRSSSAEEVPNLNVVAAEQGDPGHRPGELQAAVLRRSKLRRIDAPPGPVSLSYAAASCGIRDRVNDPFAPLSLPHPHLIRRPHCSPDSDRQRSRAWP